MLNHLEGATPTSTSTPLSDFTSNQPSYKYSEERLEGSGAASLFVFHPATLKPNERGPSWVPPSYRSSDKHLPHTLLAGSSCFTSFMLLSWLIFKEAYSFFFWCLPQARMEHLQGTVRVLVVVVEQCLYVCLF
jgi:hypothetical protein